MPREKILHGVRPQRIQQRLGFQYLQPVYIGIAPAAEIQRVAPRIRVRAHYGMRRPGARSHVGNRHITFAQLPARVIGSVVFHGERIDAIAQFRGQRLEREVHVGEAGVASGGRNLQPIQHARRRRTFAIGSVRVPDDFVIAERTDRHAVLDDVGHHRHMPVVPRLLPLAHGRHVVEHAETRAECHQIVIGELLAADDDHEMLEPRLADRGKRRGGQPTQIDAAHVRAKRIRQGFDFHCT